VIPKQRKFPRAGKNPTEFWKCPHKKKGGETKNGKKPGGGSKKSRFQEDFRGGKKSTIQQKKQISAKKRRGFTIVETPRKGEIGKRVVHRGLLEGEGRARLPGTNFQNAVGQRIRPPMAGLTATKNKKKGKNHQGVHSDWEETHPPMEKHPQRSFLGSYKGQTAWTRRGATVQPAKNPRTCAEKGGPFGSFHS